MQNAGAVNEAKPNISLLIFEIENLLKPSNVPFKPLLMVVGIIPSAAILNDKMASSCKTVLIFSQLLTIIVDNINSASAAKIPVMIVINIPVLTVFEISACS